MVHIGENLWVEREKWEATLLNSSRSPSLFARNLSRNYFGESVLIESTPFGKPTHRGPDRSQKKPLDPITLKAIQDSFEYWAKKVLHPPLLEPEVMQEKPLIITCIGKFCNDLRSVKNGRSSKKRKVASFPLECTQNKRLCGSSQSEDVMANNGGVEEDKRTRKENDSTRKIDTDEPEDEEEIEKNIRSLDQRNCKSLKLTDGEEESNAQLIGEET